MKKDEPELSSLSSELLSLPYVSANEVNYLAFDIATPELHNELYGHLQEKTEKYTTREFDDYLKQNYDLQEDKSWIELRNGSQGKTYSCTLQTYIRHSIHHPENNLNSDYTDLELKTSCKALIEVLKNLT